MVGRVVDGSSPEGACEGTLDGDPEDGCGVGLVVLGACDGKLLGTPCGASVGAMVGATLGASVGSEVAVPTGAPVDCTIGCSVDNEGRSVGVSVEGGNVG